MNAIGFDTSNYTTSAASFDGVEGANFSSLLPVKAGELGLRQSDAVFAHIKSLPELSGRLFSHLTSDSIGAIGVSTRPRAVDGSYMPCFMVGYSHAKTLSEALHVPLVEVSHQQGHVAACLWSARRMDLMDKPHLAWHLSGGTTELLLVEPEGKNVRCTRIGGTTDISAGQLIDRTGKLLCLSFPCGKQLDSRSSHYPVLRTRWRSILWITLLTIQPPMPLAVYPMLFYEHHRKRKRNILVLRSCFPAVYRPIPCFGPSCGRWLRYLVSRSFPLITLWALPFWHTAIWRIKCSRMYCLSPR